ncbi:hypothetical protein TIFTF001_040412 [Ficus carica]|uniref:Jacalin-type lectin domain-containing protein n=1 Tax=Ficus carica TaxID=3494 RepID=A0AA87ZBK2_FICCA|nr:hypothetical protein TIFTF001_040412 [Ficus carica]
MEDWSGHTIVVGPWGGSGGIEWDDGSYTGIKKINISHGDAIGSLQVDYYVNGHVVTAPQRPQSNKYAFKVEPINIAKDDYIVKVSGHVGRSKLAQRTPVVRSLKFETSKKKIHGPFGTEEGEPFDFQVRKGFISGFKGASGDLLDAIEFYLST